MYIKLNVCVCVCVCVRYTGCFILRDMVDYLWIDDFIEKFFERKLHDLKGNTWWKCGLDLTWSDQNQIKVIVSFNGNPYFLLHILIAYLESFPKHYNKVTFHWVLSELWRLKVTVPALSMYACVLSRFLRARVSAIYLHCLIYAHAHGIEFTPSQLNDSTFFFHIVFLSIFFTLVNFFKAFFKIVV